MYYFVDTALPIRIHKVHSCPHHMDTHMSTGSRSKDLSNCHVLNMELNLNNFKNNYLLKYVAFLFRTKCPLKKATQYNGCFSFKIIRFQRKAVKRRGPNISKETKTLKKILASFFVIRTKQMTSKRDCYTPTSFIWRIIDKFITKFSCSCKHLHL